MHLTLLIVSLYVLNNCISTAVAQKEPICYAPSGNPITDDSPCRASTPDQEFSACCNRNDICLDNHLCLPQQPGANTLFRGTCTDINWGKDSGCASFCQDGQSQLLCPTDPRVRGSPLIFGASKSAQTVDK